MEIDPICWVKEWQTLIAGGLASVMAFVAAMIAYRQLRHQQKESERTLRRRIRASRAMLSNDLDSFVDYLQECYTIAARIRRGDEEAPKMETPRLGKRVLDNFQALIEHLDEDHENDADVLIKVVSVYQVQNARFRNVLEDPNDDALIRRYPNDAFKRMGRDVVFLYTLIESIFPFARPWARRKKEHITLDRSEGAAARAFRILESKLSDDLQIKSGEGEMGNYMAEYVSSATQHHFPSLVPPHSE